ncbi:hypothetical protein FHR32_000636 [Streptosporangium album]|uniref:ABC transporter permease n=1 Tax=Streptosporangium album TaxID=47479 RepID=A0A7W7W716_9ACTN|nr:hypothetical protein [Streptosporangium album]MBB4936331.1 hypothetical protein [Streptosporangium album]
MIWLTWRQFRGSAAMTAALLVILAVALALTGPGLAARYSTGIAGCTQDNTCDRFFNLFFDQYQIPFVAATLVVLLLPALVGLFWGAPLITRELEAGTHLLVWNQSITRGRWLAVKLGLTGLVAMAAACLCGLAVTWWSGPLDKSAPENLALMAPLVFGARGIAPIGYAAFAFVFVLGVTMGMLVRRTLPAMALTLAVFAAIQLAMPLLVRPHLIAPVTATFELSKAERGAHRHPTDRRRTRGHSPEVGRSRKLGRLDPVQQPGRSVRTHDRRQRRGSRHPGLHHVGPLLPAGSGSRWHGHVHGRDQPARLPAEGDLPAPRPLLALPVDRDRDLRPPHPRPHVVLLLVDPEASVMTVVRTVAAGLALLLAAACTAPTPPRSESNAAGSSACSRPQGAPGRRRPPRSTSSSRRTPASSATTTAAPRWTPARCRPPDSSP